MGWKEEENTEKKKLGRFSGCAKKSRNIENGGRTMYNGCRICRGICAGKEKGGEGCRVCKLVEKAFRYRNVDAVVVMLFLESLRQLFCGH